MRRQPRHLHARHPEPGALTSTRDVPSTVAWTRRILTELSSVSAWSVATSVAVLSLVEAAAATEPKQSGWILEHFGRDVSILRTQRDTTSAVPSGQIFLSCEGHDTRLRIELPNRHTGGAGLASHGMLLLRPSGAPAGPSVVLRYSAHDARKLLVQLDAIGSDGRGITELSRLLAMRPQALDLLARSLGETSLGRIDSYVLPLRSGEGDIAAIDGFAAACLHRDRGNGNPAR